MSESLASKRIQAARTLRRFPVVGQMIARGELHVTAVCLLSKHLTEDNHRQVLARARRCSARQIEKLIAEIQPRPDVPSRVRRVPQGHHDHRRGSTRQARRSAGAADPA